METTRRPIVEVRTIIQGGQAVPVYRVLQVGSGWHNWHEVDNIETLEEAEEARFKLGEQLQESGQLAS